jgi:riboflavin synthase alpha subunit
MSTPLIDDQQFQIQNVAKDTKALKCLLERGFVSICGISVMLYLVIDQVCLPVADSPKS